MSTWLSVKKVDFYISALTRCFVFWPVSLILYATTSVIHKQFFLQNISKHKMRIILSKGVLLYITLLMLWFSITIVVTFSSKIILQKSSIVLERGVWVMMYARRCRNPFINIELYNLKMQTYYLFLRESLYMITKE